MKAPKILVLASGTKDGGGSGFEKLAESTQNQTLKAEIVAVASNHQNGGVEQIAEKFNIPFFFFNESYSADRYNFLLHAAEADYVALSGWLKKVTGLDPRKTFNIHPGPLPEFGGRGMYGHKVHEAVITAYQEKRVEHSSICMHFVTEEYDEGPVFFRYPVIIKENDTPKTLAARAKATEHKWQPQITNLVVQGEISWSGNGQVKVPNWYQKEVFCPDELK